MAAYLVANITVTNPERFAAYSAAVPAIVAQYGGRYLVRAGAVHPKEGALGLDRFVVIEFPTMAEARAFYDGEAYAPLLKLRAETTRSHVALVEGVEPA